MIQNMLGHSSLQMIFQRYYAWIPEKTRSEGKAFLKYIESTATKSKQDADSAAAEKEKMDERCTNIVPLDKYRQKKKGLA